MGLSRCASQIAGGSRRLEGCSPFAPRMSWWPETESNTDVVVDAGMVPSMRRFARWASRVVRRKSLAALEGWKGVLLSLREMSWWPETESNTDVVVDAGMVPSMRRFARWASRVVRRKSLAALEGWKGVLLSLREMSWWPETESNTDVVVDAGMVPSMRRFARWASRVVRRKSLAALEGWKGVLLSLREMSWWPETESNCRHGDFQSPALPTELSGQKGIARHESAEVRRRCQRARY